MNAGREYKIKSIESFEEILSCRHFYLDHILWDTSYDHKAYGQMAYLKGKGLLVYMTAEESDPKCIYEKEEDPVFKDSALEFFISAGKDEKKYMNVEVNANGAFISDFGIKGDRAPTRRLFSLVPEVESLRAPGHWSAKILIPDNMLKEVFEDDIDKFRFAMYKICEDPSEEHYISLYDIPSERPDFHRPDLFLEAFIGE